MKRCVVRPALETFSRSGQVSVERMWFIFPNCGDGERRAIGFVSEMTEEQARDSARERGFEVVS